MSVSTAQRIIREEHAALAALLLSIRTLVDNGPGDDSRNFFESLQSMLFYVDEFPERRHHPTESNLLFPMLLKAAPELRAVIQRLEIEHAAGEARVRELQHLLLGWKFLGESRRAQFTAALSEYVRFYLQHMQLEERELLPLAEARLTAEQKTELDAAFDTMRDPLAGGQLDPAYRTLFARITAQARNPIGLGSA